LEHVFLRSPMPSASARTTSELASNGQNRPNQSRTGASDNRARIAVTPYVRKLKNQGQWRIPETIRLVLWNGRHLSKLCDKTQGHLWRNPFGFDADGLAVQDWQKASFRRGQSASL
jgi:hypothetical protein